MSSASTTQPLPPTTGAYHAVSLPTELIVKVNSLGLSRIKTLHCLHFIDLIVSKLLLKKWQPTEYSPMGSKFLRETFNGRYKEWLDILLSEGVIQCDNFYSHRGGKSLGYRIAPDIVTDWDDTQVVVLSNRKGFEPSDEDKPFYLGFLEFLQSVHIDFDKLVEIIDEKLPKKDEILSFKRYSWLRSIRLLQAGVIKVSKSESNHRLNTNFTNIPSAIMEQLMDSNDLVEIDARNSQFAILANMIKEKVDDQFVQDAINGVLYEKVAEKLGLTRKQAKEVVMKVIYSKHYHKNKKKAALKELYPESMAIIEQYKRKSSNSELAIAMQQKESEIYIDGVLRRLYQMGIAAVSKHDSIIIHRKDLKAVESVFKEVFREMNVELTLKIPQ